MTFFFFFNVAGHSLFFSHYIFYSQQLNYNFFLHFNQPQKRCFHILWLVFNVCVPQKKNTKGGQLQWPRGVQNPRMTNPQVHSKLKWYGQTNSIWLLCTAGFITRFFKLQGRIKNGEPNSYLQSNHFHQGKKKKNNIKILVKNTLEHLKEQAGTIISITSEDECKIFYWPPHWEKNKKIHLLAGVHLKEKQMTNIWNEIKYIHTHTLVQDKKMY